MSQCRRALQDEHLPLKRVIQGQYQTTRVYRYWIIHQLFGTDAVNGLAWTQKSPMLNENSDGWMDVPDVMLRWSTHWSVPNRYVRTSQDDQAILRHGMTSRCMGRVVGNQDEMMGRYVALRDLGPK